MMLDNGQNMKENSFPVAYGCEVVDTNYSSEWVIVASCQNLAIFSAFSWRKQATFNEMMVMSTLF
jgi:hypothetical protein